MVSKEFKYEILKWFRDYSLSPSSQERKVPERGVKVRILFTSLVPQCEQRQNHSCRPSNIWKDLYQIFIPLPCPVQGFHFEMFTAVTNLLFLFLKHQFATRLLNLIWHVIWRKIINVYWKPWILFVALRGFFLPKIDVSGRFSCKDCNVKYPNWLEDS